MTGAYAYSQEEEKKTERSERLHRLYEVFEHLTDRQLWMVEGQAFGGNPFMLMELMADAPWFREKGWSVEGGDVFFRGLQADVLDCAGFFWLSQGDAVNLFRFPLQCADRLERESLLLNIHLLLRGRPALPYNSYWEWPLPQVSVLSAQAP